MSSYSTRETYREQFQWLLVVAVAAGLRLYDLGTRAMSYDETQHSLFSYLFYLNGEYSHSPLTHGPLLFHLGALSFHWLGVSDFTARLAPALAGVLTVAVLYFFRDLLGKRAALLSALFLTISPVFLFYSRYIRNDIYICLFSLVWVLGSFRYLQSSNRRWLVPMFLAMALSFTSKETAFIFGLIIGLFLAVTGWTQRWSERGRRHLDLAVLMFCVVLPFASPILHFLLGWPVTEYSAPGAALKAVGVGGTLWVAGLLIGAMYLRRQPDQPLTVRFWFKINTLFWAIQVLLFTTLFRNFPRGLVSGVIGSLGYWLTQQEVQRGGQPSFYYGLLAVLYEFLPLLLGLGGLALAVRILGTPREQSGSGSASSFPLDRGFFLFLVWWSLASWILYALAGEKMPWLLTQVMLPVVLLAGWFLSSVLDGLNSNHLRSFTFWGSALGWAALALSSVRLLTTVPHLSRDLDAVQETASWLAAALLFVASLVLLWKSARGSWKFSLRSGVLSISVILFLLTVRSSLVLSFQNFDTVTELLVYAHGTPDIKSTLREIDRLNGCAGDSAPLKVAYDTEANLPFGWYLRPRPNASMFGSSLPKADPGFDIILVGEKNWNEVRADIGPEYLRSDYRLISWPEADYRQLKPGSFLQLASDSSLRKHVWSYFLSRPDPGQTGKKFHFYVKRDRLRACEARMSSPMYPASRRTVLEGTYNGLPMKQPRALALGKEGEILVADSGNHRLILVRPDETYLTVGSHCSLFRNPGEGCEDPDGDGPLEKGDGQFDEPWGVALDSEGRIYVADTWNGRIQVFDAEGRYLRKWGSFGAVSTADGDCNLLYGPRDLLVEPTGSLLVSDTGNKRVLRFSEGGECISFSAGGGAAPGLLDEPVGLATDQSGELLIADTWNHRVQAWTSELSFLRQWETEGWDSRGAEFKPYLTVDSDRRIIATDPGNSRLIVFDRESSFGQLLDLPPAETETAPIPTGIVFDEDRKAIIVSDAANGRLLMFDWPLPSTN